MFRKKTTDVKKIAIGAGIAAAAGYLAGVLTAPQSGKKTRKDIKKGAGKAVKEAEKDMKKVAAEVEDLTNQAKNKGAELSGKAGKELNDLVDKAKVARDKATTILTAVKKGEAKDVELQLALDESKKALKNLGRYLKK